MKMKIVFATGTALGLLMVSGAAFADGSNNTSIQQNGTANLATVNQSNASSSAAGTTTYSSGPNFQLWQIGTDNSLSVTQTGKANNIAVNTSSGLSSESYTDSKGMTHNSLNGIQDGNNNTATILQNGGTSAGNQIGSYYQINSKNSLSITQDTNVVGYGVENAIGETYQKNTGSTANTLTITQTSDNNFSAGTYSHHGHQTGNSIGVVKQNGTADTGTITQTGNRNYVASLTQTGDSDTADLKQSGVGNRVDVLSQNGSNNTAKLHLDGDYNGSVSGSTVNAPGQYNVAYATAPFSSAATTAGVTQGTVKQTGNGNTIGSGGGYFLIDGDNNAFGFMQDSSTSGAGNTITGSGVIGSGNQLAVSQTGNSANSATFNIAGSHNELGVTQIDGGTLVATINGDNNNESSLAPFTGNALTVAGLLVPGQIYQNGLNNSITLKVGDTTTSSSNLFAFSQTGGSNTISATIKGEATTTRLLSARVVVRTRP